MAKIVEKMAAVAVAFVTALSVSACTTTAADCDPSQDVGFFNKIGCAVSGSYSERVEQKEQQVADLKAETERLNAMTRDLHTQSAIIRSDYQAQVKVLDHLEDQLYGVKDSLAEKKALNSDLENKIASVQAQMEKMRQEGVNQTVLQREQERAQLQQQLEELRQQVMAVEQGY